MTDTSLENIERVARALEYYSGEVPRRRATAMIRALGAERDALAEALREIAEALSEIAGQNKRLREPQSRQQNHRSA